ncbi:hypothetical protein [Nonomuraea sp. NPDC049504]|uniref:hypothetical protein n=1 Tax=Nonomuraea sp. NPDC049504 TaxID=3154729 RepID=UPI00342AF2C0
MNARSAAIIVMLALASACSGVSPPPRDHRPLGDVMAAPRECDLISTDAIRIATGFRDYVALGTKLGQGRFGSCSVSEDAGDLGLVIEVFDPSPHDAEDLERTRQGVHGQDLPAGLSPGFAARRAGPGGKNIAFVYGWTSDHQRLLSVKITEGAAGRDSVADAVEFFRQLRPVLLDERSGEEAVDVG